MKWKRKRMTEGPEYWVLRDEAEAHIAMLKKQLPCQREHHGPEKCDECVLFGDDCLFPHLMDEEDERCPECGCILSTDDQGKAIPHDHSDDSPPSLNRPRADY